MVRCRTPGSDLVSHVCTESSQVSLNLYLHSKVASFLSLQSLGRLFESFNTARIRTRSGIAECGPRARSVTN